MTGRSISISVGVAVRYHYARGLTRSVRVSVDLKADVALGLERSGYLERRRIFFLRFATEIAEGSEPRAERGSNQMHEYSAHRANECVCASESAGTMWRYDVEVRSRQQSPVISISPGADPLQRYITAGCITSLHVRS